MVVFRLSLGAAEGRPGWGLLQPTQVFGFVSDNKVPDKVSLEINGVETTG